MKYRHTLHNPSTMTKEMTEALSKIKESLITPEELEAYFFLEMELQLAMAYITELQWDVEEAAALIRQSYFEPIFPEKYRKEWAIDCLSRLVSHQQRTMKCMKEQD